MLPRGMCDSVSDTGWVRPKVYNWSVQALQGSIAVDVYKNPIVACVALTLPTLKKSPKGPDRLTLSNRALYFESLGVGQYENLARNDLSRDLKQVIKPELTGPLDARLFDKAVMYRSMLSEHVFLEFPEFKGSSHRDYWLDITLEVLRAHRFTRKFNLRGIQEFEAVVGAILGILRCRAVREAFLFFLSHYKSLHVLNLVENLPGGDTNLETLASCLLRSGATSVQADISGSPSAEKKRMESPLSLLTLSTLGLTLEKDIEFDAEATSF